MTTTGQQAQVSVIGGGLAGSECALQLADRGIPTRLYEMKPLRRSPAHHSDHLAEIVCSNSFGASGASENSASGLLKREMAAMGCRLLSLAESVAVPAGQALAVDRDRFAEAVTAAVRAHASIEVIPAVVETLPTDTPYVVMATGPLTAEGLVSSLQKLLQREQLYFFDAASPILTRDSINMDIAFLQNRYGKGKESGGDSRSEIKPEEATSNYINCPLNQDEYLALVDKILTAEKTELKSFEKESARFFESCLPIEEIASRGVDTLRYGPMKPVGLTDPRTGRWPYAVVQLRQDNTEGTLFNMVGFQTNLKWGAQKEMIQMIPGLENADVVRYGVMHRNTYLHSPEVLLPTLQLKTHPGILVAGQLTGTEGYTESIATGMMAAINIARMIEGQEPVCPPKETMLGSLLRYITRPEAIGKDFQPINSNWGILPPPEEAVTFRKKDKTQRNAYYNARSQAALAQSALVARVVSGAGQLA